jgi:hypothetical protein
MIKVTRRLAVLLLVGCLAGQSVPAVADGVSSPSLEENFLNPPESAKPKTWWHWMGGCISQPMVESGLLGPVVLQTIE